MGNISWINFFPNIEKQIMQTNKNTLQTLENLICKITYSDMVSLEIHVLNVTFSDSKSKLAFFLKLFTKQTKPSAIANTPRCLQSVSFILECLRPCDVKEFSICQAFDPQQITKTLNKT